jgi:hypothetical protein
MTPDPYRNAYEKALSDIAEITARFEQLRTRKGQVENLIAVLQPIFGPREMSVPEPQAAVELESAFGQQQFATAAPEEAEPAGYSFLDVPNPVGESMGDSSGDPFERRVRSSFRFRGLSAQRSY